MTDATATSTSGPLAPPERRRPNLNMTVHWARPFYIIYNLDDTEKGEGESKNDEEGGEQYRRWANLILDVSVWRPLEWDEPDKTTNNAVEEYANFDVDI